MKLRIQGNSVRLRVLRSDVTNLMAKGRIEETIHFGPENDSGFSYALAVERDLESMQLRHAPSGITVVLPMQPAASWAETNQVGLYATVDLGAHGVLDLLVEKDFACLDLSDLENEDTFPNPQIDAVC